MSIFTIRPSAVCAAALLAVASVGAQAASISFEAAKTTQTTDWSDTLSFSKFDTSLGTLTSITFDLGGTVSGIGEAESRDTSASKVTLDLGSKITLSRPDTTALVVTNPVFSKTFEFSAFDGNINFAGTSGGSTGQVSKSSFDSAAYSSASDLALFTGPGNIALGLSAKGTSTGTGSGNLISQFSTLAAANAKVTYNYTAAVPEPETYALMLAGLGLMGAVARRRRAAR